MEVYLRSCGAVRWVTDIKGTPDVVVVISNANRKDHYWNRDA